MDQIRTGRLIRTLRLSLGMTQLALAERLGVSDKAVSKWERGCGAPDLSLLPLLSQTLGVDTDTLLRGDLEANDMSNGNLNNMRFYVCPDCGNLIGFIRIDRTDAGGICVLGGQNGCGLKEHRARNYRCHTGLECSHDFHKCSPSFFSHFIVIDAIISLQYRILFVNRQNTDLVDKRKFLMKNGLIEVLYYLNFP